MALHRCQLRGPPIRAAQMTARRQMQTASSQCSTGRLAPAGDSSLCLRQSRAGPWPAPAGKLTRKLQQYASRCSTPGADGGPRLRHPRQSCSPSPCRHPGHPQVHPRLSFAAHLQQLLRQLWCRGPARMRPALRSCGGTLSAPPSQLLPCTAAAGQWSCRACLSPGTQSACTRCWHAVARLIWAAVQRCAPAGWGVRGLPGRRCGHLHRAVRAHVHVQQLFRGSLRQAAGALPPVHLPDCQHRGTARLSGMYRAPPAGPGAASSDQAQGHHSALLSNHLKAKQGCHRQHPSFVPEDASCDQGSVCLGHSCWWISQTVCARAPSLYELQLS